MADLNVAVMSGLGSAWSVVGNIAQWVFYIGIAVVVIVVFLYFIKFKYPITLIFETMGGGKRIVTDRARKDKKKSVFSCLKNRDITFPYPESEHEYIKGKGIHYIATVRNQSASFLTITQNPHFIAADYDMREKLANDFKNSWSILKPNEAFWDKYGAQILWVGSMGVFLVVIILILQRIDKIIELGKAVAVMSASQNKQVINSILPIFLIGVKRK